MIAGARAADCSLQPDGVGQRASIAVTRGERENSAATVPESEPDCIAVFN